MSDEFIKRLQEAQNEEQRDWLAVEFSMQNLSPALRQGVQAAAVPHWFDGPFLSALLEQPDFGATTDFQTLVALSFVQRYGASSYLVHDRTRRVLLHYLHQDSPAQLQQLSAKAATYCAAQDQENVLWRAETFYHRLHAGEEQAADEYVNQGIDWYNQFEYTKMEALARPVFNAIQAGRLDGKVVGYTYYLLSLLQFTYSQFAEAKGNLEKALASDVSGAWFQGNCYSQLGRVDLLLGDYEGARHSLEAGLQVARLSQDRLSEANCLYSLGDVYYVLDEYLEARKAYQAARRIYLQLGDDLGVANSCLALGVMNKSLGNFSTARRHLREARRRYGRLSYTEGQINARQRLGELDAKLGRVEQGVRALEEAARLFGEIRRTYGQAHCYDSIAYVYKIRGDWDHALEAINEAIRINPMGNWYLDRADLFIFLGRYDQALQDLDCLEKLRGDPAFIQLHRGRVALGQKQPAAGLERLHQAAALRPKNAFTRLSLAQGLLVNAAQAAAFAEMETGLQLVHDPDDLGEMITALEQLLVIYGEVPGAERMRRALQEHRAALTSSK
jgi:tetratricopeptide (TPR) repeat protein